MNVEFGEINGISRGASAEHDAHERREIAVGGCHAGEEKTADKFVLEDAAGNHLAQMEADLTAVDLDVEGTEGHAVVGADKHLQDKRLHLGIARGHRKKDAGL